MVADQVSVWGRDERGEATEQGDRLEDQFGLPVRARPWLGQLVADAAVGIEREPVGGERSAQADSPVRGDPPATRGERGPAAQPFEARPVMRLYRACGVQRKAVNLRAKRLVVVCRRDIASPVRQT